MTAGACFMTAEEQETWRQAEKTAYQLLNSVAIRDTFVASKHLDDLALLIQHLRQIQARERRTGWGEDDG